MRNFGRQQVGIALFLMAFLVFGSVSASAGGTHGSDRLVKGAAIGAAAGAVTQMIRGRTTGREMLKGAAVGASVGAAAGAYSDYKQEKRARERAERRYDHRRYDNRYDNYYGGTRYRDSRPAYRWDRDANYSRGRGHRHGARCGHRR
jgi:uncharacterized protein YcfJ